MRSPLYAVLPGGIDDPAAPSGGNLYDRIVLGLLTAHRDVHEIAIHGSWPTPGAAAQQALTAALASIPDGAQVLLDGLVACGVPALLAPHAARLRLVILVHLPLSDETSLSPAEAAALQAREREALHLARTVVATSHHAAANLMRMHEISETSVARPGIAVAVPGVEQAALAEQSPDGRRLLCVAAVTPRKGQDLLVTALENHLADLEWQCTFTGRLTHSVPFTSPDIHFTGPRTGPDLDAIYAAADLFVLPSRAETYGMVVTEALARGLPVLATAVGGVPEALGTAADGTIPGRLIPPDDPDALAAALRDWLSDPELRARWRAAALSRRTTLPTWDDTVRSLLTALGGTA